MSTVMRIALPVVGAVAGSFIPGLGTMAGLAIGEAAAGLLYPLKQQNFQDLKIQNYSYGAAIPLVFGTDRLAGTVIWANNKTPHSHGGGVSGGGSSYNSYTQSFAVLVCAGPVNAITRIWADSQLIYDAHVGAAHTWAAGVNSANVRFYMGTSTQAVDPVIEIDKGSMTPAFRNRAYVVFQDFDLTNSNGQIPNMEFEVSSSSSPVTLDTVVKSLCQIASRTAESPDTYSLADADFNLSALSGITIDGYTATVRGAAKDLVASLQDVYQFDIMEIDGLITAVLRATNSPVSIPDADLGARPYEESGPGSVDSARLEITRSQDVELPRRLDFVYRSIGFFYQPGVQSALRNTGYSSALKTSAVNIVLSDDKAREVADIQLHDAWIRRTGYVARLPFRWYSVAPGDVLSIPGVAGESRLMKVTEVVAGLPGQIVVTGVAYDPDVYNQAVVGAGLSSGGVAVIVYGGTVFILADLPALRPQDSTSPGFYAGACSDGAGIWHGATLYTDRGAGYIPIATFTGEATIGATTDGLPTGPTTGFDTSSTVTVQLDFGTLSSCSESAINNDPTRNACMVGNELIQFATATLSGTTWTLSDLKRGLKGTPTTGHVSGEKFMLLDGAVIRVNLDPAQVGIAFNYKGVTQGVDESTVTTYQTFTVLGNSVLKAPAAPTGAAATAGSTFVSLSWTAAASATSYNIFRGAASGGPYVQVGSTAGTSFTDSGLTNGTTYYYVIQATNSVGMSPYSSQVSATPTLVTPSAPVSVLAATWVSGGGLLELFTTCADSAGATSYNVYNAYTSGGEPALGSASFSSVTRPFSLTADTTARTSIYIEFTAQNSSGESAKSAELNALKPTTGEVGLIWTPVTGATYNVYKSTTSGAETLYASGLTSPSVADASVTPGTTYYYQVTSVVGGVESAKSNEVKATP